MSLRVDVRRATERAAAAERQFHDCYLALVSGPLAREPGWTPPVQLKFEHDSEGLVSILVREAEISPTNSANPSGVAAAGRPKA